MQKASVATERVSATLNAGQSLVLTVGLTAVLAMAASGGTGAGVTAGDLVSPAFTLPAKKQTLTLSAKKPSLTLSVKKQTLTLSAKKQTVTCFWARWSYGTSLFNKSKLVKYYHYSNLLKFYCSLWMLMVMYALCPP